MINIKKYIVLPVSLLVVSGLFFSCNKGEDIRGVGFGSLEVSSVFSGEASPLLVQVDGETRDTLSVDKPYTTQKILIKEGEHQLVLFNMTTQKALTDTTITVEATKTISLPKFYYTGDAALFDDLTAKPSSPDNMLVRVVTLDPSLPDVMDLKISVYDYASVNIPLADKMIKGVRKDRFSGFIELPDPATLAPPDVAFILYAIEGYDPNDNNKKVMSIENGTNSYFLLSNNQYYIPNAVVSMGIGAYRDGVQEPFEIFERIIP
ncbi:hypothetical protein F0L74_15210 [Chitinophaga agrisoli]|uniref:Uncharacterized protein n=1 Tax=Chitinophaga agrisoli TaxID=2607653 RepID=A0A5B2VWW9_9BACT|nr:hypothetical protein [Chitinophaga agrisoli]KAA2243821.1 hypothetical protein F0L74_15210 [Chitinophaga agrisoli]